MLNKISKRALILGLIMSVHFFYAQTNIPTKETQKGFGQLDFLSIKMPGNEENMDFTGLHYNLKLNDWSYAGLGFYGAVGGIRGGFFTLGINAGIQQKITKNLFLDTGFHFGGGGGAAAPDGGGAFILPHFNLGYDFKYFSATAGYSYINFFDKGDINSSQLNVAVQIPLSFDFASFKEREQSFSIENLTNTSWDQKRNRASLLVHLNNLSVTKGNLKGKTIRLAGFEFNSYLNDNIFFFVKADGAYHGIKAGYMDILLGGGYHLSMNKNRTNILAKFGVGAGGGGGVDTKGGFLIYPDISIEQKLFDNIYGSINKGYLMSPDGHFTSSTLGFGLKYYIDKDGIKSEENSFSTAKLKGLETIVKHDLYFNAARDTGINQDMHQISLQINFFFNKYIYGAGQTSFANFGDAGAYAEGIVGLGVQSNSFFNNTTSVFLQALAGAAGGGGISTGQGLIIKPSAGVNYKLTDKLNLRAGLGYVKARGGSLSSSYLNFGISYNFSYLSAK
ncbi:MULTISPECIES: hypothetical protein [unclassified Tenacibaculum]|uniref:hypothetical protein n=1 Tax=unclassified Tenacibaculum TaxID=2635139 RepID=UPI001F46B41C|nr:MULTISPECIES: hypothetical protein [unclassified Tenacibaculum]MCF2873857.1 hypothetical protein [Tenacibaculum sp. Cn5-1]MCF2936667.1 hypothetical protein [Tenacibaculum sp. Cn5-34]MCG7512891.1 hypothetical protein [Tenacibaculum sp. Cn5-46]